LDDQHRLFALLNEKVGEINEKSDNQYLVILPGLLPFVALEVNETSDVYEIFTSNLQPTGVTEWYIPTKS
jgi:hypothetical protein